MLFHLDTGAFGTPAFEITPVSAAALAGHPNCVAAGRGSRHDHFQHLVASFKEGDWAILNAANGTYCAAFYDRRIETLHLVTDKIGVRSLYIWIGSEYVVFASALRILEAFSAVPKKMDLLGATEAASFGFPLAGRSGYTDILHLYAGERITVSAAGLERGRYWRWENVAPSAEPRAELLRKAYQQFHDAVSRLAGSDTGVLAFLSGGLDSRCITGVLRSLGRNVRSCSFGWSDYLDCVLAAEFSAAAGTYHSRGEWVSVLSDSLASLLETTAAPPFPIERPRLVWSGDGGSVGVGHVYVNRDIVEALRRADFAAAAQCFIADMGATAQASILASDLRVRIDGALTQGIAEELTRIPCEDPVKRLYVFLLENDQRCHLSLFFEDIDLHRFDLLVPFFDGALIETMMSLPPDWAVEHRFYNEWLKEFPPAVTAVPWQFYPGHAPCPLPLPKLADQWNKATSLRVARSKKHETLEATGRALADFPKGLLDRNRFRIAMLLYRTDIRDYKYLLNAALAYHRYWRNSSGRWGVLAATQAYPDQAVDR